ncbi:hypothetical protein BST42_27030 [Mycolicibacterium rhodesiae]|uniref:Uncharacterized protein n=1 Tax=Mycolicibacterium rhodesiae TaxID=36814 RepID=A0A1X0IJ59_MYCRH|nr:hypothetical protein BST42_27030 [Mycolicibacterium rhodesiae]
MNGPQVHPDAVTCIVCREVCAARQVTRSGIPAHYQCQLDKLPRDEQNPGLMRYDGKARHDD